MSNYILSVLRGRAHARLMGFDVTWSEDAGGRWCQLHLISASGNDYHIRFDMDRVKRDPDQIEQEILNYAMQITKRENNNGLSRQSPQASPSHSSGAQSGTTIALGTVPAGSVLTPHQLDIKLLQQLKAAHITSGPTYVVPSTDEPKPKAEPIPFAGFHIGELTAVRGWKIGSDGFLHSMSADVVWAPGEPMDGKTKAGEEHCGIFAYKKARDFLRAHGTSLHIYGKVHLWGDVIEHELGYRAEYAKIISLDGVLGEQRNKQELTRLRERYGLAA